MSEETESTGLGDGLSPEATTPQTTESAPSTGLDFSSTKHSKRQRIYSPWLINL
jgi:hypothetical protein